MAYRTCPSISNGLPDGQVLRWMAVQRENAAMHAPPLHTSVLPYIGLSKSSTAFEYPLVKDFSNGHAPPLSLSLSVSLALSLFLSLSLRHTHTHSLSIARRPQVLRWMALQRANDAMHAPPHQTETLLTAEHNHSASEAKGAGGAAATREAEDVKARRELAEVETALGANAEWYWATCSLSTYICKYTWIDR